MNKIILIIMFAAASSSGQFINKFGIKGGINISQLSFNSNFSGSVLIPPRPSYSCMKTDLALFAEFFDSRNFCTSVELHYFGKGEDTKNDLRLNYVGSINNQYANGFVYVNNRMYYLSLQILPRWRFIIRSDDKMYFFGGITLNWSVSNSNTYSQPSLAFDNNKLIPGIKGGYGIELWDLFYIELSYTHDFTNAYVLKYREQEATRRHDSFELLAGFSLKKLLRISF